MTAGPPDYVYDVTPGPPFWRDPSFHALLHQCPALQALGLYLGPTPGDRFAGQLEIDTLPSSYRRHKYADFFYALIRALTPDRCVEIGLLNGYSLLAAASALRDNGSGMIHGFDLFDRYPYRHADQQQLSDRIRSCGLSDRIRLDRADVLEVHERWDTVDYLHVDISNDGDLYRRIFEQWSHKVTQVILLEGGSAERDRVAWMHQYSKAPIAPAIEEIRRDHADWSIAVLEPFPSLTVAIRHDGPAKAGRHGLTRDAT